MKRTPLKRKTPMKRVSKRRQAESKEYMRLREAFLKEHDICQLWMAENNIREGDWGDRVKAFCMGAPRSTEIHHVNGRNGSNYLDTSTWMAVCRESHERIENNKSWARDNGYLGKK